MKCHFIWEKVVFLKKFEKKTLFTKIDQRGRHPSRYHTWSKLLTFCVFRLLEQVVFEHNYCFWIILSIKWTYFLTTVYSIAQNLIWSNDIFLTNCVERAYFLISQCPYTFRMVETLSLYLLIVANEMALHETPRTVGIFDLTALVFEE